MATTVATVAGGILERINRTIAQTRLQGKRDDSYGAMCRVIASVSECLVQSHQVPNRSANSDWVEFQHRLGPSVITPEDLELAAGWLRRYQAENVSKPGWFLHNNTPGNNA